MYHVIVIVYLCMYACVHVHPAAYSVCVCVYYTMVCFLRILLLWNLFCVTFLLLLLLVLLFFFFFFFHHLSFECACMVWRRRRRSYSSFWVDCTRANNLNLFCFLSHFLHRSYSLTLKLLCMYIFLYDRLVIIVFFLLLLLFRFYLFHSLSSPSCMYVYVCVYFFYSIHFKQFFLIPL